MQPIYTALVYTVWFLSTYFIILFMLYLIAHRKHIYEDKKLKPGDEHPFVSIVVPAFNEEGHIGDTIESLKCVTYKAIEFIIVNDGSSDGTSKEVIDTIGQDSRFVFIDNPVNKGKAACLNQGAWKSTGKFVATMDADSVVETGIIEKTLPYFKDPKAGAVTVSVEAKDTHSFLHKIIRLEYILGLSLFLKVFSFFNCVFVTPGPFSIYRRSMLVEIGGFDENNITEDFEIAFRIHKSGYRILNAIEAKVETVLPPTFKKMYIQRKRWYSGALKTVIQHKDILFKKKYGAFGFFIPFNYALIVLGLSLFLFSQYLGLAHAVENLWYFQYTNYNFLERIMDWEFDILSFGSAMLLGMTMFAATVCTMFIGLKYAKRTYGENKLGMIGYPFLFVLYQIFWAGAIWSVIRGKRAKWR